MNHSDLQNIKGSIWLLTLEGALRRLLAEGIGWCADYRVLTREDLAARQKAETYSCGRKFVLGIKKLTS